MVGKLSRHGGNVVSPWRELFLTMAGLYLSYRRLARFSYCAWQRNRFETVTTAISLSIQTKSEGDYSEPTRSSINIRSIVPMPLSSSRRWSCPKTEDMVSVDCCASQFLNRTTASLFLFKNHLL